MKIVLKILLPVIVVALGVLGAMKLKSMKPEVKPSETEVPSPLVEVVEAVAESVELRVNAQGTVVPRTESRLVAEVSGRVVEVAPVWVDGGFFEAEQVLLRLDTTDYELAKREAEVRVAQAELRLAQEEADAEIARRDWKTERGEEPPPPLAVREPQVAEARTGLAAAESALEKARRDVERCTIVAPYAGRVRTKGADLGEFVSRGIELGLVYAVDYAEVRVPLPDAELAFLDLPLAYREEVNGSPTSEVTLTTTFAGSEYSWTGRIVRTEGELDPKSRMVIAVVRVEDPYGRSDVLDRPPLAIGMFVDVSITGVRIPDAIALPRSALRLGDQVYVLDDESRLRIREIDVLRAERDRVLVRGGLEAGERVIVSPLEEAVDGMQVREYSSEESSP